MRTTVDNPKSVVHTLGILILFDDGDGVDMTRTDGASPNG